MKWIWPLSLVLVMLLAACGAPEPTSAPVQVEQAAPAATEPTEAAAEVATDADAQAEAVAEAETEVVSEETAADAQVVEATAPAAEEASDAEESTESVADIGPPPAFSPDLKASDPAALVLGAGKPQLVEFFAFW